jgi:hypothetical protein
LLGPGRKRGREKQGNGGNKGEQSAHGRDMTFECGGIKHSHSVNERLPCDKELKERSMHVGMAAVFQNTGRALSDHQIYLNELALADMAEPLGFESIWSVEHHFFEA